VKLFYKKIGSLLFVFFMIFQCVPSAFADSANGPSSTPWSGAGTTDDPYVITTADQLNQMRVLPNAHYKLDADINLDVPPYNTGKGWQPIGTMDEPFYGTLDGNGYKITGLYINRPDETEVALFGFIVNGAGISNVKLEDVDVTGDIAVGGLVGWNNGGSISSSSVSGTVNGYSAGGLIGDNSGSINDSYASGNVTGAESVGGLVGYNFGNGTISNSHATSKVTGGDVIGGLVGYNSGGISDSYASGEVNGGSQVGGLIGYNIQVVSNTYASGEVTGNSQTGGLVGSSSGTVTNSYWDTQASGQTESAGGEGKTTDQLKQPATFADNWEQFAEIWAMDAGGNYPVLRWQLNIAAPPPWSGEGTGTENKPFLITTAEQLNDARYYLNAHFELGGDIDLGPDYGAGEGWEPIGAASDPFLGILDGRGYKISGLFINRSSENEVGLFSVTGNGAEISNIRLENIDVTGNFHVGGLVAINGGDISNVYVSGAVTGSKFLGGLTGDNSGNITRSYSRSKVEGVTFAGGLVGTNGGNIGDSYANGEVIASSAYAGGLVGSNEGGTIRNSYASGKVTSDSFAGGLVSEDKDGTVTASYWDKEATGQTTSAGSGDEYGRSTVEMKQQATFADWDFDTIWAIEEGESYPYLQSDYEGAGLPWTGSGTGEDPYVIKTAAHLNQMRDHRDAHFKLGANINLDVLPYNTGEGWEPIDWFNGKFDGKGFKITGLYIDRSREDVVGLFGHADDASEISNVTLEDVSVTVAVYDLVGGLVGYNYGSISYSSVSGRVKAHSNAGVLVGYNAGNISYSSASGEMTGISYTPPGGETTGSDILGGLAGVNAGNINQSYASSIVNGIAGLGGLVGVNDGNITNSYAIGDVIPSESYSGGLVGYNDGYITDSYASGKVIAHDGYFGGLVGYNKRGKVNHSFWDKETTGVEDSAGSSGEYGRSTSEMKQQATFAGWDFDSVWEIEEDERYPYLKWVSNANLSDLTLSEGILRPVFTAGTTSYKATVKNSVKDVDITATAASGGASLEVNGTSAASGAATAVPLRVGRNTIHVVVTGYDGMKTNTYTIEITRESDDSDDTQIINVPVEAGSIGSATTVMQTTIARNTGPGGKVRDEVILTADRAGEAARRIAEAGQTTARIKIPDEEDKVSQVDVNIRKAAIKELVKHNVNLEIFTENIRLLIPQQSMDDFEDDLYFRIVPMKEQSQRDEVENRARSEQVVIAAAKGDKVNVVSRPMTIETNMPNRPVTLILPLRDVELPSDAAEREKFLQELMVFIEHSDGEKRLAEGKIVEYKGGLLGIEFEVNKFSTFTILHMEGIAEGFHEAYIRGYEDGTFKPNHTVTRAEIAVMIAGNLGIDNSVKAASALFSDVSVSHWAARAIEAVQQRGLMIGDAAGAFNPNAAITRAEMAAIVARYKQLRLGTAEESITAFSDITGHWAALEIAANKQAGILNGYENGTFRPNGNLTRAEAVRVINRMFDRGPLYEVSTPAFADVKETHWAFHEVEEAARDHFFIPRFEGGEYKVK